MRIGMVSATYDPGVINGALRMVTLYKKYLEARGHQVVIFTLGKPRPGDTANHIVRSPGIPLGDHGYYWGMGYSRSAQLQLAQMDVVHCHHLLMGVEMAHRYARCPIVYTNHTRYDLYTGAYTALPQPAADAIMRQVWPDFTDLADTVIAPSDSMRQLLLDFGVRSPLVVIENGIELEPFQNPPHPITKTDLGIPETAVLFIYTGRLSSEKNLLQLIEQFAHVTQQPPEAHLLLVGQGPQEPELRRLVQTAGLEACVHFPGVIPPDEVGNWLAAADCFVTASISEVHPLTVIEALAAGLPITAVNAPGLVDVVVDGQNGILVESPDELSRAMLRLGRKPNERQRMGLNARQTSYHYAIGRTVSLTLDLYEQLLETRPDLRRERMHGAWSRRTEKWGPLLEQLARTIRPPTGTPGI